MKMSKVMIMAVMLCLSISYNAMAFADIERIGDTAYTTADLSFEIMFNVDVEPVVPVFMDLGRVTPVAELRHSAGRVQFKAKTAKLPIPPRNYRQRSEVGWRS
jgi:hypothetical protein